MIEQGCVIFFGIVVIFFKKHATLHDDCPIITFFTVRGHVISVFYFMSIIHYLELEFRPTINFFAQFFVYVRRNFRDF